VTPAYYQQILDILSEPEQPPATVNGSVSQDPISTRELEVLRLIARGFTNLEIADTLDLSGYLVKQRIESVHGKLGVWTHAEALHKARALGLLAATDD
jgi:LuxR family maltose regulon positive regulatory protein